MVEDILRFLFARVVELEEGLASPEEGEDRDLASEMEMTSRLIDLVLYRYHGLGPEDIERVEASRQAPV